MPGPALRSFVAAAAAALTSALASDALASDVAFESSFDVYLRSLRTTPRFTYHAVENDLRAIGGGKVPSTGAASFLGAALDLGLAVDDRWMLPLLGIGGGVSLGSHARVLTSIDGSMVELRPWTMLEGEVLLPGFGVRFKERRWLFAAALRTGYSFMSMKGTVTNLVGTSDLDLGASSFALRLPVEACRRIDPMERACLVVTPHLYEFGWATGASVAVRWEWGP
ncbi:MAG: hypothetical protein JWM74_6038 [Myxococcaceae bacterium]|nr:hypothetical protein [Myxococcaceae bacterium]